MIEQVTLVTASNVTVILPFSSLKMDGLNGPSNFVTPAPTSTTESATANPSTVSWLIAVTSTGAPLP